jgi:hypothetical protein
MTSLLVPTQVGDVDSTLQEKNGESGVTVEALAAILAPLGVSLGEFFTPHDSSA